VKNRFGRRRKSLPTAIVAIVLLLSAVSAYSQSSARDVAPVLEGLDPVMLVQGKEVQGDLKISVTRGKFQYLFANADNKASFEKDPARYEIQLDGACARMGAPVTGNPDLYTVHQGRIYIFGSEECKKRFDAAPQNYLETANEVASKPAVTREAAKKAKALIETAVAAMGGASRIDGLISYQEKSTTAQTRRQGDVEVKTSLTVAFPDRIRFEQVMPDWNDSSKVRQVTMVISAGEVFGIMGGVARQLPDSARIGQEKEVNRRLLSILRARKSLNAAAIGSGKIGETLVEQVAIEIDHASYTLGIDPATGRILSLSAWRRGPEGNFGQFVQTFSDFRAVDGLTLPFKITGTFNSQPWKEQSPTVETIAVNRKIDPALFEKPKVKSD
jgi:YHS domain-containing protein